METNVLENPWEKLSEYLVTGDQQQIIDFLDTLTPSDTALAVSRLSDDEQSRLLTLLRPENAAEVLEDFSDALTVDVIGELEPSTVASIFEELDRDHAADLLGELDEEDANSIIDEMAPQDAEEVRALLQYAPDTAGGLMISEYLKYRSGQTVQDVLNELQANR